MEVPATIRRCGKEILVKSGDKVSTGSLIMRFEYQVQPSSISIRFSISTTGSSSCCYYCTKHPQSNNNISGLGQEQVEASTGYAHATPVIRRLAS